MTTGPVTVACPICRAALPVPTEVVAEENDQGTVVVRMDYTALRQHVTACDKPAPAPSTAVAVRPAASLTPAELGGRVERMLSMRAYVAPGKRACTMCGTSNAECMASLSEQQGTACCAACSVGDHHPVPQADVTCAAWAAEHGAQN